MSSGNLKEIQGASIRFYYCVIKLGLLPYTSNDMLLSGDCPMLRGLFVSYLCTDEQQKPSVSGIIVTEALDMIIDRKNRELGPASGNIKYQLAII